MKKRWICLLLALVCVGSLVSGCGGNSAEDTTAVLSDIYVTPDMTGAKVTQYIPQNSDIDPEGSYVNLAVEEHLGLDLEIIEPESLASTCAKMVQQWEIPDLVVTSGYNHSDWGKYGEEGAFINILDYLEAMPNVKAYLEDPENAGDVEKFTYSKGVMYALPIHRDGSAEIYTYLYRKDIFEENNLTWPTNQEEFVAVLRKLKEIYPDSEPFVMRNMNKKIQAAQLYGHLWGAAHVTPSSSDRVFTLGADGKYYLAQASIAYKEMAQFFHDLMEEGLMNRDSLKIDTDGWYAAFNTNKSFITYDKVDRLPLMNQNGKERNEKFQAVAGEAFNMGTHANQTDVVATSFPSSSTTGYGYMIGENANLDAVLLYVDWLYSEEGYTMTNWGVEGESYVVNEDGTKRFVEGFLESKGGLSAAGFATTTKGHTDFEAYKASCEPYMEEALNIAQQYVGRSPRQYALQYTKEEKILLTTYAGGMYSRACSEWNKFVRGERDFSEWDAVMEQIRIIYNYDGLLKVHEDALARVLEEQ